jgi:hypothetical protein
VRWRRIEGIRVFVTPIRGWSSFTRGFAACPP